MNVLAEKLGPGLMIDKGTGRLQVKLSQDSGNTVHFGSDEGVKDLNGTPPQVRQTIADLPKDPGSIIGAETMAALHFPYSSPHGLKYCLAEGFDMVHFHVGTSSDDVGIVTDYNDQMITNGRTSVYVSRNTRQMSASLISRVWNYAGDEDDPVGYQRADPDDIAKRGDRRGGWYGWLAQKYHQPLLSDVMQTIDGRTVAILDVTTGAGAQYLERVHVIGALRGVLEHGAQEWAMIGVKELPTAATVIGHGITPILMHPTAGAWGETKTLWTPDEVKAAGVEWVMLPHGFADNTFKAFVAAGINVLMRSDSRHSTRQRAVNLGIRGALCADPNYYRGGTPAGYTYGYRSESDPWENRTPATGQLTHKTDTYGVSSGAGLVRGRTTTSGQGLVIPKSFGSGVSRPAILAGWVCPITNPEAYSIAWDARWNSMAANASLAKLGILFGAATDQDPYFWPKDDKLNPQKRPAGPRPMYRAFQRQNGEIGIGVWPASGGEYVVLAKKATPAMTQGTWSGYRLTVAGAKITLTRTMADGTKHSVATDDTSYRGAYFHVEKEETVSGSAANPFEAQVRNVIYKAGA
ncbi:hypothetical protein ABT282_31095 [Streptomyces sp. NPDC000927]|uniref:hypothetical protein n=1 Tax=Streptomyces sp. NPDC000927 TaxID=3154371 RepID=UPI003324237F